MVHSHFASAWMWSQFAPYLEFYEMNDSNQPKRSHLCDATRKWKVFNGISCVQFFVVSTFSPRAIYSDGRKKNWNILDRITGGAVSRVCWVKARREFAEMKWQSNKPKAIAAISLCSANAAPRWRWRWQCFARNCSGSSSAHTIFSYVKYLKCLTGSLSSIHSSGRVCMFFFLSFCLLLARCSH